MPTQEATFKRSDVRFASGETECAAWLYLPERTEPGPAVVLGHGLGAIKEMGLDAYAERFAGAGYAALVFDYRHFGASGGEPRQLLDIKRQLADWAAALRFARAAPQIDSERIAIFGSSFGGGHVILTAARDQRVAAAIAQCPFTDGLASALTLDPLSTIKVTALALRDLIAQVRRREPVLVALAGEPRSAALMNAPDVMPGYLSLLPDGVPFTNGVAARVALRIIAHRPGTAAKDVGCPILFCVCEHDSVAPARATLRHAARAPRGEVTRYACGHFDIYRGEHFERAVSDQIAFLRRNVP
ncbi:MAG: alpha/beta fold hydrolase [Acidobacteriota bacterium]|nr:alpha/beta fold hydrolase [Acidobacteriota bacterium]